MSSALQKKFIVDLKSGVISPDPATSDVAIIQREQYAKQLFFTILDPDEALGKPASSAGAKRTTCHLAYKNINKYNPDEYTSDTVACVNGVNTYGESLCFCASLSLTETMTQFPGKLLICLQILDADPLTDDPSTTDPPRYFRTQPLNLTVLPSRELTISEFWNEVYNPDITDEFKSELDALFNSITITSDKIQDGAVTNAKIQNSAVTSAKIATGEVTGRHLSAGSVANWHIVDDSITAAKITSSEVFNEPLTYYIRPNSNHGFNTKNQAQQESTESNGVITTLDELITQYYLKGLSIKAAIGINDDGSSFFWGDLLWISGNRCVFGGQNNSNYYQLEFIQRANNLVVDKYAVFSSIFRLRAGDDGALGTRSDGTTYHPSIPFSTLRQHYLQNDLIRAFIAVSTGAVWGELTWLNEQAGVFTAIYETTEYKLKLQRQADDSIEVAEYKVTPLNQLQNSLTINGAYIYNGSEQIQAVTSYNLQSSNTENRGLSDEEGYNIVEPYIKSAQLQRYYNNGTIITACIKVTNLGYIQGQLKYIDEAGKMCSFTAIYNNIYYDLYLFDTGSALEVRRMIKTPLATIDDIDNLNTSIANLVTSVNGQIGDVQLPHWRKRQYTNTNDSFNFSLQPHVQTYKMTMYIQPNSNDLMCQIDTETINIGEIMISGGIGNFVINNTEDGYSAHFYSHTDISTVEVPNNTGEVILYDNSDSPDMAAKCTIIEAWEYY